MDRCEVTALLPGGRLILIYVFVKALCFYSFSFRSWRIDTFGGLFFFGLHRNKESVRNGTDQLTYIKTVRVMLIDLGLVLVECLVVP